MSLYRVTPDRFEPVARTTFAAEKMLERKDLQRLLRKDITPIADDLMVIAEEYGDWEDSNRRIDLLCISEDADLVVVEIKRTADGGHMELQAIRYAAMVSGMTFDQVVAAFARTHGVDAESARSTIVDFIEHEGDGNAALSGDVRIVLVAADFSTEVTTTVLWLNKRDLDIRCVRLRPHRLDGQIVIDATQIIPLPEAAEYEVKVRELEQAKRKVEREKLVLCRAFWAGLLARAKDRTALFAGRSTANGAVLSVGMGRGGFAMNTVLEQGESRVEMFFRPPGSEERNLAIFNAVHERRPELEAAFGEALIWDDRPGRLGWKIYLSVAGGWRTPEEDWPPLHDRLIDVMIQMDRVLKAPILEASV
jgi:hypothetical protein